MSENARYYTPAEAGVISGLGRKAIDNAIDKRVIPLLDPGRAAGAVMPPRAKAWRRRLISESELVWLYVHHEAAGAIPRGELVELFKRFLDEPKARHLRVSSLVILDIASGRARITERATRLERAKRNIVSDPSILGGEPVFRGTRVPVYDVAASARKGISSERIRAAYASLDQDGIEDALLYAEAFPPRGRPRGSVTARPAPVPVKQKVVRRKAAG